MYETNILGNVARFNMKRDIKKMAKKTIGKNYDRIFCV